MPDTSSTAFYRLSEELLGMIVEHTRPKHQYDRQLLKNLRLVHSRFAHLQMIQRELHHAIEFPAIERAGEAALSFKASYVTHVEFHAIDQKTMERENTKEKWIEVLSSMKQAKHIDIGSSDGTPNFLPFVVDCMNAADIRPTKLMITQRYMSDDWHTPKWSSITLQRLECLGLYLNNEITGSTLCGLLSACQTTLSTLFIECCDEQTIWPDDNPPALPALTKLHIDGGKINPSTYAAWIAKCHRLEHLSLCRLVETKMDDVMPWKPVFDAIRNHPSKMFVDFDEFIHKNYCHKIWIYHHTSQPAKQRAEGFHRRFYARGPVADWGDSDAFELENYMSGHGPWTFQSWADSIRQMR